MVYQLSRWTYRWDFGGSGSIRAEIQLGGVKVESDGGLSQRYWHVEAGSGVWKLDPDTLGSWVHIPADQPAERAVGRSIGIPQYGDKHEVRAARESTQ